MKVFFRLSDSRKYECSHVCQSWHNCVCLVFMNMCLRACECEVQAAAGLVHETKIRPLVDMYACVCLCVCVCVRQWVGGDRCPLCTAPAMEIHEESVLKCHPKLESPSFCVASKDRETVRKRERERCGVHGNSMDTCVARQIVSFPAFHDDKAISPTCIKCQNKVRIWKRKKNSGSNSLKWDKVRVTKQCSRKQTQRS